MSGFVGRTRELRALETRAEHLRVAKTGRALAIRGRRQVGKSRLVQVFCDRVGLPYVYFTAIKGASAAESIRDFSMTLKESTLAPDPERVPRLDTDDWGEALRLLAGVLPDEPSIVVLDEVPWLAEQSRTFEGYLQVAWDRTLSHKPVLLLLLGSDIHMMERLTSYDRPFYGRADNLKLGPLNPTQTGAALGLGAADALDAQLISGGLPGILNLWPHGTPPREFIEWACFHPDSALFNIPETVLLSEFPAPDQSKRTLEAIGSGDRTHANIAAKIGGSQGTVPSGALTPILRRLVQEKQVLALEEPLSTKPGKPALYRVEDSNLRLYLGVLRDVRDLAFRDHPEEAFALFQRRWTSWRGRAVEPIIRESLETAGMIGALPWEGVKKVGGWWNRKFQPEIDLVGADRGPVAGEVSFVGSIKWLGTPFDHRDLADLQAGAPSVPGCDYARTGTVVVSLSGVDDSVEAGAIDVVWGPKDVLSVWKP